MYNDDDPVQAAKKETINNYLCEQFNTLHLSAPSLWALVLDSKSMRTSRALAKRTAIDRIVIPNDAENIRSYEDGPIVLKMSSHDMIDKLSDPSDDLSKKLVRLGFPGSFSFVYLDYCGSWSSRSGKRRQQDIERLLRFGLISETSILAYTSSQRGSAEMYTGQTVDEMILNVLGMRSSAATARRARLLGIIRYDNTNKSRRDEKYENTRTQPSNMITVAFMFSPASSSTECISKLSRPSDVGDRVRFTSGDDWKPQIENVGSSDNVRWTPLACAVRCAARSFAEQFDSSLPSCNILVQDTPMLIITNRIRSLAPSSKVCVVVSAKTSSANIARTLVSRAKHVRLELRRVLHVFDTFDVMRVPPFRGVWFGNSQQRVFSFRELTTCVKWASLNAMLRKRLVDPQCGVVSVYFGYPSNGMCWVDAAIDYVVNGFEKACHVHSYNKPNVVYVSKFCVRHPRAIVIFRFDGVKDNEEISHPQTMPKAFWEASRWDWRRRTKMPSRECLKYRAVSPYVVSILEHFRCQHVLLHEPGCFSIAPSVLSIETRGRLTICAGGDPLQYEEFALRFSEHDCEVKLDAVHVVGVVDAAILLDTCERKHFLEKWSVWMTEWLSIERTSLSILIVMTKSDNHEWLDEFLSTHSTARVMSREIDAVLTNIGLKYHISAFILGNDACTNAHLMNTWRSPSISSIQGCKISSCSFGSHRSVPREETSVNQPKRRKKK